MGLDHTRSRQPLIRHSLWNAESLGKPGLSSFVLREIFQVPVVIAAMPLLPQTDWGRVSLTVEWQ